MHAPASHGTRLNARHAVLRMVPRAYWGAHELWRDLPYRVLHRPTTQVEDQCWPVPWPSVKDEFPVYNSGDASFTCPGAAWGMPRLTHQLPSIARAPLSHHVSHCLVRRAGVKYCLGALPVRQ